MPVLKPLMIAGTGSDVGKSILVAGLCRIFKQDGLNPAPFKAQNMALNSYVTSDGLELGRAQAVQAEAAGIECSTDMNPILLKPVADCVSQVILHGKPIGNRSACDYFQEKGRLKLAAEVHKSFDKLSEMYNPIVMEGAGSLAEINLMHLDIVNLPMAYYAGASVILVADISRGGVFASVYGSIQLLQPKYRKLIKGIIINKFRGDISLFEDGRRMLQEICGVPIIGVMPFLNDLHIEEEDSYFHKYSKTSSCGKIKVAVIKLSHISNFTDFDPLQVDQRFEVQYTLDSEEIRNSDIIIVPGSKASIIDLLELYHKKVNNAIIDAFNSGKTVIGICGGYQMLGQSICDPNFIESSISEIKGLGLLPIKTVIGKEKVTRRVKFNLLNAKHTCSGYEIHMGESTVVGPFQPFAILSDGTNDGCKVAENCFGTYLHGLFENKSVVDQLAYALRPNDLPSIDYSDFKEMQYNRLADEMRNYLDMNLIYKIMSDND